MRRARNDFQRGAFDQLRRKHGRVADGHDLVVVAVKDQRGHVEFLEIFGEVGFGERFDAVVDGFVSGHHALQPEGIAQALRDFRAGPVGAVEGRAEVLAELRAVGQHGRRESGRRLPSASRRDSRAS